MHQFFSRVGAVALLCVMVAGLTLVAYLVEGVTGSVALGLFTGAALLVSIVSLLRKHCPQPEAGAAV